MRLFGYILLGVILSPLLIFTSVLLFWLRPEESDDGTELVVDEDFLIEEDTIPDVPHQTIAC